MRTRIRRMRLEWFFATRGAPPDQAREGSETQDGGERPLEQPGRPELHGQSEFLGQPEQCGKHEQPERQDQPVQQDGRKRPPVRPRRVRYSQR